MVEIASKVNKIIVSEIEKHENRKKYDMGFKIVSGEGKFGIIIKGVMMIVLPEKYRVFDMNRLLSYFGEPVDHKTITKSIDFTEYQITANTCTVPAADGKTELMIFDNGHGGQIKVNKDLLKPFYFPGMIWQCKDERSFLIGYSSGEPCVYLLGVR